MLHVVVSVDHLSTFVQVNGRRPTRSPLSAFDRLTRCKGRQCDSTAATTHLTADVTRVVESSTDGSILSYSRRARPSARRSRQTQSLRRQEERLHSCRLPLVSSVVLQQHCGSILATRCRTAPVGIIPPVQRGITSQRPPWSILGFTHQGSTSTCTSHPETPDDRLCCALRCRSQEYSIISQPSLSNSLPLFVLRPITAANI